MTTPGEGIPDEAWPDDIAQRLRDLASGFGPLATGGEVPPPTGPPIETTNPGFPEGERGRALGQILGYAVVAEEETHDDIVDEALSTDEGRAIVDLLQQEGASLDDAAEAYIRSIQGEKNGEQTLRYAQLQYGSALEATGLLLEMDLNGIVARMKDPRTFAAALRELPLPEDDQTKQSYRNLIRNIIEHALTTASARIFDATRDQTRLFYPNAPHEGDKPYTPGPREDDGVPIYLPESAATLAQELRRFNAPDEQPAGENSAEHVSDHSDTDRVARELDILDAAHQDNKVTLWALANELDILNWAGDFISVDRLIHPEDWEPIYRLMEHLQATAPQSPFTQQLRDYLARDLNTALSGNDTIRLPGTLDAAIIAEGYANRQYSREVNSRTLRRAAQRLQKIWLGR